MLDAASELMVERDTVDVSVADIAARAGLNTQLIRYYFGSKEGLLLELLKRVATRALGELNSLVVAPTPPVRKIELHIGGIVKTYFRFPYTTRLLRALVQGESSRYAAEVSKFFVAPLVAAQRALLEQCAEAGLIRHVDPMFFYFSVVGACDFLFASRYALRDVFHIDAIDDELRRAYASHVVALVMEGMRSREKAALPLRD